MFQSKTFLLNMSAYISTFTVLQISAVGLQITGVKRSSASVCLSVSVSVCPHNRTKTAETADHHTCHSRVSPSRVLSPDYPFNIRSKGHRVIKCKNILKAIEWSA